MGVGVHASVTVTNESLQDSVIKREMRMHNKKKCRMGPLKMKNWWQSRKKLCTGKIRKSHLLVLLTFKIKTFVVYVETYWMLPVYSVAVQHFSALP